MKKIKNFIKSVYNRFNPQKESVIYCRRCGRKLRTAESKALGVGKCCYQKELRNKYIKPLF